MANSSQCRDLDVPDTYVISEFSTIMDMCAIKQNTIQGTNNFVK